MLNIDSIFNETFSHWDIRLPPEALKPGKRGKICQRGWAIWYLYGQDSRGEYLDYYASHRMTYDQHVRIYADGHRESLPAICGLRMCSDDPKEEARLEAEHTARIREIEQMLREKGFGLSGDEPGGVQMNRLLRTGDSGNAM